MAKQNPKVRRMLDALHELARIAGVMVDGEEAGRIMEGDTARYIINQDPAHGFLSLDHFVVDHEPFLRMKKTLIRLSQLADFPVSTCLWVTLDGLDGKMVPLVQNGAMGRYYRFGCQSVDAAPEMVKCLDTGEAVAAPLAEDAQTLTVLAPVSDSLGDVAGLVELSAAHPINNKIEPGYN